MKSKKLYQHMTKAELLSRIDKWIPQGDTEVMVEYFEIQTYGGWEFFGFNFFHLFDLL